LSLNFFVCIFAKKFSLAMKKREEVEQFLREFIAKSKIWDVIIRTDRTNDKNELTLFELEIKYADVARILCELTCEDYSDGPIPDKLYNISDMWIFGKIIKKREVYIKIQLGWPGSSTICISFHLSEYKMKYPFKIDSV
jgi:hypothetical protein